MGKKKKKNRTQREEHRPVPQVQYPTQETNERVKPSGEAPLYRIYTAMDGDVPVSTVVFNPNGTDHILQREITKLMHRVTLESGQATLANMGYYHVNTLTYQKSTNQLMLRVFFDARLALYPKKSEVNGNTEWFVSDMLNTFRGYLISDNARACCSIEKAMMPKSEIVEDENGRPSLRILDSSKLKEADVLVLNCSLPMTIAAILDVSLTDPLFGIRCTTVGKGSGKAETSIITGMRDIEVPVQTTVTFSDSPAPYDPEEYDLYMTMLSEKIRNGKRNRSKLKEKVRDKAKEVRKKETKAQEKTFNRYS